MIVIFLFLSASAAFSAELIKRTFALELEYGAGTYYPLPLTELGSRLYGSTISGNPVGGNIIYVFAPRFVAGIDYRTYDWGYEKGKVIYGDYTNGQYAIKNKVNITQITAFIDLAPLGLGKELKDSITNGFFIEVGPCLTELKEEYIIQSLGTGGPYTNGPYSFTARGMGIDLRVGYRTISKEPLSFFIRGKMYIPVAHDNNKSESGLSLNGAITSSYNAGLCLTF